MIKVVLKNGTMVNLKKEDVTSWEYDGKLLCFYKKHKLVAVFNADNIISMINEE